MLKDRLIVPDMLKGLMIILMVFGHLPRTGTNAQELNEVVYYIYIFHMPIFLILSGYFFVPTKDILKVKNKVIRRVFIPYVIFLSIYLISLYYANYIGLHTSNMLDTLSPLDLLEKLFIHPIGAYWFLHTLLVYQLLCFVIEMFCEKQPVWLKVLYILVFSLFLIKGIGLSTQLANITFILIGYLLKKGEVFPNSGSTLWIVAGCFYFFDPSIIRNSYIIYIIFLLSFLSFLSFLFERTTVLMQNYLSYIGRNTLIILLVHAFFVNIAKLIIPYMLLIDKSGILFSLIATFLVVHFSILTAKLFDKMSMSRFLFGQIELYSPYKLGTKS